MIQFPTLYTLAAEYRAAAETLADLDIPEEAVRDTLESLSFPFEQKAANVAMFTRNLESTAEAIKNAEVEMAARRRAIENRVASLREYLKQQMEYAGIQKIESPHLRIAIRNNPASVVIDCINEIPSCFMRYPEQPPPPPPVPDKKAIAAAIKDGKTVPGAHLHNGTRLDIH